MHKYLLSHSPLTVAVLSVAHAPVRADAFADQWKQITSQQFVVIPNTSWKWSQPAVSEAQAPDFDDSGWKTVAPGFQWEGEEAAGAASQVWFRTRYVVPETIGGASTGGDALHLEVTMDDDGEIYVNGKLAERFHWDEGNITLAEHVRPGQVFDIALRGINKVGPYGQLLKAQFVYDTWGAIQPEFGRYRRDLEFLQGIETRWAAGKQVEAQQVQRVRLLSQQQIDLEALRSRDWNRARDALAQSYKTLLQLSPITRRYDLYYIGHSHIDMNWLWTWPETIDVAHRTWDSAMNLMDQFPDFGYVQSQPGVYVPIQEMFPDQFRRIQDKHRVGQWNLVGGLWNESDTNLPSGEALARSLFLGQRYFKAHFGRYASVGWLPDSFGHSWQMPQLMQGVGIQNFYHMRGGDNIPLAWWRSPDGSQVLTAKTDSSYNEPVLPEQLLRPWQNEKIQNTRQATVIFGVGDHGGGPTRAMFRVGKEFQADPLLPRVHFVTGDKYFEKLRRDVSLASLPVINTDLQYVAVGCYTTHADMKKAVRDSENNLYTGEVFASLASMLGQPYPTKGFEDAWKPTAFAQFHDIVTGSAIHSTYDWMHEQFAPAFAFEKAQIDKSLAALTANVDTTGSRAGERPVVVWNALSFARPDVVRVNVDDAPRFSSVRDAGGVLLPVQAIDERTIAFVARDVPAFGHKTYFLSEAPPTRSVHTVTAQESAQSIVLENEFLRATIAKSSGHLTGLFDKRARQEMIRPGESANVLQVLGDKANAWDIDFTGEQNLLGEGAQVQLVSRGPVCAVVRVKHGWNKSTFSQDITLWNGLPRLDVPSIIEWHEHAQMLKAAFPLNMAQPAARVGIPYGSIERPTTGQEYPGQKWMDVSEQQSRAAGEGVPLPLDSLFNSSSTGDFDTENRGYDAALLPSPGIHRLGVRQIPFRLSARAGRDNISCNGQIVPLPANSGGKTLYLLGSSAMGDQSGLLTVEGANGRLSRLPVHLNDWAIGRSVDNEEALTFGRHRTADGLRDGKTYLWVTSVPLPAGDRPVRLHLPYNLKMHLFAATFAAPSSQTPRFGLTVLNDCKYGADTIGNLFRLTLLRSSSDPDPNPDEGTQTFTYSLLPHAGDWRQAQSEQAGLGLNIPLRSVLTDRHRSRTAPLPSIVIEPTANIVAGALKHCEDGPGYILRLFETQGRNTTAHLRFSQLVRVQETDILERPLAKRRITVLGHTVTLPMGHGQVVTLRILGLPDA